MNNQTALEQTIIQQALELNESRVKILSLEGNLESLRQLARDNQNEISRLKTETELLDRMRKTLREHLRNLPIPHPLSGRTGPVNVTYGDFEISVSGIACVVTYEKNGSSYGVDFCLVPVPAKGKNMTDFYPGFNFDVWTKSKRRKPKPSASKS